jgi:transcriptional regulator with XRE-family HTH domain
MIERVLEVLKVKNLSPSQFADEIGVQRSSISHLVSGRNKPSLEFIQKIIKRFPDINPEYILSGVGNIFRLGSQTELDFFNEIVLPAVALSNDSEVEAQESEIVKPVSGKLRTPAQEKKSSAKVVKAAEKVSTPEKPERVEKIERVQKEEKIERIVYFFKDKTFKEYFPGHE